MVEWMGVRSGPVERGYCAKFKLKSYPQLWRGCVIWVYMGPPEHQPPLPEYEFATVPQSQSYTSKRYQECNWLQALEGGIDSSHVSFLHIGSLNTEPMFNGATAKKYNTNALQPLYEAVQSDCGLFVGAPPKPVTVNIL